MATDLERLTISLEANVKKFENEMRKQNTQAARIFKDLEDRASRMESSVSNSFSDMARKIAQVAGTAFSVRQVQQLVDTWQEAGNKIRAAGVGDAMAGAVQNNIADIATRSRSSFADVADLYARLTRTGKDFGATQGDVAVATETVAKALKVSGASASEVQSTLVQLGQALGSGKLQGDELRSLLENAPVVAQAIAKEFGVTVGQLKDLGAEGKLVSDRVFKALVNAAPEVGAAFDKTTGTIADSFTALENAALKFVGNSQNMSNAARIVSGSLGVLAKNFDLVAGGATALGAILAARMVSAGLVPLVASVGTAVAGLGVAQTAAGALGARALLAAGAVRTLSLALSLVGGPVGAALLGAGVAVAYLATQATEGKATTDRYAQALASLRPPADDAKAAVKGVGDQVADTNAKMNDAAQESFKKRIREDETAARDLTTTLLAMVDQMQKFGVIGVKEDEKKRGLDIVKAGMDGTAKSALEAADEIRRLGEVNPSFANAFSALGAILTQLAAVSASARIASADLAGVQAVAAAQQAAKTRRKEQDALETSGFKPDTNLPNAQQDKVFNQLRMDGKVAEAALDEQTKKIKAKTEELYKAGLTAGDGTTLKQAEDAAKRIVAIEEAAKKGSGGGGKSDGEKAEDRINRYVDSLARQNLVLQAEIDTFGKSNIEKRAAIELAKAGVDLNRLDAETREQMLGKLQKEIGLSEELRTRLKGLEDQKKAVNEANQFFAESITDSLTDLIVNGGKAEDVLKNLVKQLAKAAIQAALMGTGPLAGIFGTKGSDGAVGGIFGLLGGIKFASGGFVSGPGSARSDSIPARLSNGEFVVNAGATKRNRELLEAINSGRMPKFADGGIVGRLPAPMSRGSAGGGLTVNVQNNTPAQVETRRRQDGGVDMVISQMEGALAQRFVRGQGTLSQAFTARQDGRQLRG